MATEWGRGNGERGTVQQLGDREVRNGERYNSGTEQGLQRLALQSPSPGFETVPRSQFPIPRTMVVGMGLRFVIVAVVLAGCMGAGVNTAPVPELAPGDVTVRGSEANALSVTDESEIVSSIVRGFFRPIRGQVRWIDQRPLADERSPSADEAMRAQQDRAEALVRAIGLPRVCVGPRDGSECANQPGGVLRFSPAYRTGQDRATIFAEYRPLEGGPPGEIEFQMVRNAGSWHMASRRSLGAKARENPARGAADRLLAVDRAFGDNNTDLVSALSAMFDVEVFLQAPAGFAAGKDKAIASLRSNPDNERSRTTWAPIRVGVSADGLHGFTYGYMTLVRPDSSRVPLKYLAYWVNRDGVWRVLAYKRRPRPAGEVSTAMLPPALPSGAVNESMLASVQSLRAAEKEFSDTSQVIGIGAAFERYGRADAMNMGGPNDTAFVIGNKAIGRSVGAGYPPTGSPVYWSADMLALAAASGDLGITFGFIRPHQAPPAGQPQAFPFFTIWKREPGGPWRYIAE